MKKVKSCQQQSNASIEYLLLLLSYSIQECIICWNAEAISPFFKQKTLKVIEVFCYLCTVNNVFVLSSILIFLTQANFRRFKIKFDWRNQNLAGSRK